MKRIIYILLSIILLGFATSCEVTPVGPITPVEPKVEELIIAEWGLIEISSYSNLPVEVFVQFFEEVEGIRAFDLYQKVGDVSRFRKYSGTYSVEGSILRGEYDDGEEWGSAYRVAFEEEGATLVLTAVTLDEAGAILSEGEITRYIKSSLSSEEKDAADLITKTEFETAERFL